jgi:hypothetical protein
MHFFILLVILPLQWSGCRESKPKSSNEILAQHKVHPQEVDPLIKIESSGPMPPAIHEILEGIFKSKWAQTGKRSTQSWRPSHFRIPDAVRRAFNNGETTGTVGLIHEVNTENATSLSVEAFQYDGTNGSGIILFLTFCDPVTDSCHLISKLDNPEGFWTQQGPTATKKPLVEYVQDIIDESAITDGTVVTATVFTVSFDKNPSGGFRFSFSQAWNSRTFI